MLCESCWCGRGEEARKESGGGDVSLGARAPFWQSREIVSLARTVMVSQCSSNFRVSSILLHCRIAYSQDLITLHEHLADLLGSIPNQPRHRLSVLFSAVDLARCTPAQ